MCKHYRQLAPLLRPRDYVLFLTILCYLLPCFALRIHFKIRYKQYDLSRCAENGRRQIPSPLLSFDIVITQHRRRSQQPRRRLNWIMHHEVRYHILRCQDSSICTNYKAFITTLFFCDIPTSWKRMKFTKAGPTAR